jgi:hypothetical protein
MLMLCLSAQPLRAQVQDSVVHSPTKAWLLSAALPGLGQAYNQRYWKIPVIYAGFAAFGYFIQSNNFRYKTYRDAYNTRYAIEHLEQTAPDYDAQKAALEAQQPSQFKNTPTDRLQYYKNLYRRDRDFFIIMTTLFYMVNMVDAAVDAHFFTYDISNDLSLNWQPYVNDAYQASLQSMKPTFGINLSITF